MTRAMAAWTFACMSYLMGRSAEKDGSVYGALLDATRGWEVPDLPPYPAFR